MNKVDELLAKLTKKEEEEDDDKSPKPGIKQVISLQILQILKG